MFYGFLAIAIALPLAMSRPFLVTYDSFDLAKIVLLRIFTLSILALWIANMLVSKKVRLYTSKFDPLVLGFLVLVFLSTFTAIHFPTALHGRYMRYEGLFTFLNYGILYFLALQVFTSFEKLSKLSRAIVLGGGLTAFYGVIQYMGFDPLAWTNVPFEERRSFSAFGNPDLLAGFLVILTPITIAEFFKAKSVKSSALMGTGLFLALMCLLTTFTRGAWIAAAVALLVFIIIGARGIVSNPKKLIMVLAAFVVIFAVIAVYSASTGHDVMNLIKRLQSTTRITDGSAGMRIETWKAGLKMTESSPLLGLGPDTFRLGSGLHQTLKFVEIAQGKTLADNAHNYVIQLASGVGVPAGLIFLVFFVAVVVVAIRYSIKLQDDERLTYAGLISAILGYFIHLLFGLSMPGSTSIFWIIIGALVARTGVVKAKELAPSSAYASLLKSAAVVVVIISVISSYFALTMFAADYYYAQARGYDRGGVPEMAILNYESAIGLYKNGKYYQDYGLFMQGIGLVQGNPDLINKAIDTFKAAKEWEPDEADHYMFLANLYLKIATGPRDPILDTAIRELNTSIEKRPYAYSPRLVLANVLLTQNRYDEAIEMLKFVLDINPNDAYGVRLMAQCNEGLGNKNEAIRYYEKLLSIQPDNNDARSALDRLGG